MTGERERLHRFINALDREYMAASYEQTKADSPPSAAGPRTDVPRHKRRPPTKELSPR